MIFLAKSGQERWYLCSLNSLHRANITQLLVCGRPGSGCTSLLKIISNYHEEFETISGEIRYGNATPREAQQFRNQIVMNTEDDVHFPTLKVKETIDFAVSTKIPKSGTKEDVAVVRDAILDELGIRHTKSTMVGNEVIRGVSGGERKRVSLAEAMATQVLHPQSDRVQSYAYANS